MSRTLTLFLTLALLLTACSPLAASPTATLAPTETPVPTVTPSPLPTATPLPSETPVPTETPAPQVFGPEDYPAGVNPLTGLPAANPALLERRPVIIKVSNIPRSVRPQWGLSLADIVYEYYTEYGSTRFAAIFYGNDAERVGPIRSGRFVDIHLIRMYQGLFAFGSADYRVRQRMFASEFADRLLLEWTAGCPAMCRYQPNGPNHLVANTAELSRYADAHGIDNQKPDLRGMVFSAAVPVGGAPAEDVRIHYSLSVYNRWEYRPESGKYLRWVDTVEASLADEQYALLSDGLTGQPITAENVLVLFVRHEYYSVNPEIFDIQLVGSGSGYLFRDGQGYPITWRRVDENRPLQFFDAESGEPIPLKPGQTWIELTGLYSTLKQEDAYWQFVFGVP